MNLMAPGVCVLLAEDDENDVALLREALAHSGWDVRLLIARDGQEAVDYLTGGGLPGQPDAPARPDLVLLDITMPRLNGFEVLHWMRAHLELRTVPVVMLSYSIQDADRRTSRLLGASEFRIKTRRLAGTVAMLQEVFATYLSPKVTGGTEPAGEPRPLTGW